MNPSPPGRSFCIQTTTVTTTKVMFSPIGDKTKSENIGPLYQGSTVNKLRNYRLHTKVHNVISNSKDDTVAGDNCEVKLINTGFKKEKPFENSAPHESQNCSRVSVICANRTKPQSPNSEEMEVDKDDEENESNLTSSPKPKTSCRQSPAISSSNTIECPICSSVAIDHLHYGGLACFSCKAFFRRTVVTPSKKSKRCRRGDGKCMLTLGKRNNCPPCRFQRCLDSGMKPSLVLSGKANKHGGKVVVTADQETKVKIESSVVAAKCFTEEEKLSQILHYHRLVISQTAGVNLLTIPTKFLAKIQERINLEMNEANQDLLCMAQLELAFLIAKDCVVFFTKNFSIDQLLVSQMEGICPALIFTSVQEFFVQLIVFFLKNCPHFQSLTWACQARLLRKNIADVSVLLMTMCFEKNLQVFRWGLGSKDMAALRQVTSNVDQVMKIDKSTLAKYLNEKIGNDIFEVVNSLSQLEIPGHVLIVLVLICMYTRDGMLMEKQHKVDSARNHYQQLLFRYMKKTNPEDQCSRLMATLHRALKTVKDFAEKIRSYEVVSVRQQGV